MIESVLLYGSKARNDHDRFSDTDLLGVTNNHTIQKPFDQFGVSFHVYPMGWMEREASKGSLFLLHITREAKPVFDPINFLERVRGLFVYKDSYVEEMELGCRVVSAALNLPDSDFSSRIRRRYFWGLRTALMAKAAQSRNAAFSARALEELSDISGLALHIQTRSNASVAECRRLGDQVLDFLAPTVGYIDAGDRVENLRRLLGSRGVGAVAADEIMYASSEM